MSSPFLRGFPADFNVPGEFANSIEQYSNPVTNSKEEDRGARRASRKVDPDTLDFIYEHTKEGPNLQFRDSDHLDTKITV